MKAKLGTMKVRDKVLVMLPTDHNELLLHWKGPYTVTVQVTGSRLATVIDCSM